MEGGYLEELREKINNKNLDDFWIACYKSEYKPLKITKQELLETINKNVNRYIDKKFANIGIYIKKGIKNYDVNHDNVFAIRITIYTIGENGKFLKGRLYQWCCLIKYNLFDLLERKFTLKDLYIIVKATNDEILRTDCITGINYNELLDRFKKHKIDF